MCSVRTNYDKVGALINNGFEAAKRYGARARAENARETRENQLCINNVSGPNSSAHAAYDKYFCFAFAVISEMEGKGLDGHLTTRRMIYYRGDFPMIVVTTGVVTPFELGNSSLALHKIIEKSNQRLK